MTPFRSHGKGSLVLKGTFGGVKIERASGTHDLRLLANLRAMLATLADGGRLDVLEQVAGGQLKLLALWRQYRGGDWSKLPTPEHAKPLAATFETWRLTVPGDRHRDDLGAAGRQFAGTKAHATVADLPAIVGQLRAEYAAKGAARTFNRLRDAASAFLKQTLTRQHALYLAVRAIVPLTVRPKYVRPGITPSEAWIVSQSLGAEAGRLWWLMCCTGMGPEELWTDGYATEDGHLRVNGKKRRTRRRLVPQILTKVDQPVMSRRAFESRIKRSGLSITPYVGRRSFARWMEECGILETHQQAYLGHGARTITDLYRRPTIVVDMLDADAERLASWLAANVVGKVVGPTEGQSSQVVMTRAGIEPAAYGLKVRCSTN
jgi:integrase